MKTAKQKFKSKIQKAIIRLTNQGNHTAASKLYQTYFLFKKSIMNKQFFAMVFFIISFIGANYYAPEHLPQQPTAQIK